MGFTVCNNGGDDVRVARDLHPIQFQQFRGHHRSIPSIHVNLSRIGGRSNTGDVSLFLATGTVITNGIRASRDSTLSTPEFTWQNLRG